MTETSTANLAEWLLEQIAESRRRIEHLRKLTAEDNWDKEAQARWEADIARFDPAMVDLDAKRRIVERHAPRVAVEGRHEGELICRCSPGEDEFLATVWPCADVRDIASVFADRPGYLPEWRPE